MPTRLRPNGMQYGDSILDVNGSAPSFCIRAFCNFNGTTMVLRGAGNVTDVTYNGVGNYRINFTTILPSVNFATVVSASQTGVTGYPGHTDNTAQIRSSYSAFASQGHIWVIHSGTSNSDPEVFMMMSIV